MVQECLECRDVYRVYILSRDQKSFRVQRLLGSFMFLQPKPASKPIRSPMLQPRGVLSKGTFPPQPPHVPCVKRRHESDAVLIRERKARQRLRSQRPRSSWCSSGLSKIHGSSFRLKPGQVDASPVHTRAAALRRSKREKERERERERARERRERERERQRGRERERERETLIVSNSK